MNTPLPLLHQVPLQALNTFGIAATARHFLRIEHPQQLGVLAQDTALAGLPRLILGGGSNVILPETVDALVLHMANKGRRLCGEDEGHVYVQAQAGENWHEFVLWTLEQGWGGLENLALIPGTVGAAPVQNIGAYGVELKDVFHSLTAFDFATGTVLTLNRDQCCFAYRDSVFKQAHQNRMAILDVTLALPKHWQAQLGYGELARALIGQGIAAPGPQQVCAAIMAIRRAKLPDPATLGNAGSFFKNPLVSAAERERMLRAFPQLVSYAQADGSHKLAAGWLIEQCGWKGRQHGAAGVYEKQALVLVNRGGATAQDVRALADAIMADVWARFAVRLEIEPVMV